MGPQKAAEIFKNRTPDAALYRAVLYGSLAATGKGHLTDAAIKQVFEDQVDILWKPEEQLPFHPNGMKFYALDAKKNILATSVFYSTGGGAISETGKKETGKDIYDLNCLEDIIQHCISQGLTFYEYVFRCEGDDLQQDLADTWKAMQVSIEAGLRKDDILPGDLKLRRKAWTVYRQASRAGALFSDTGHLSAYALAVSEENAGGGTIVTAPTCGSCGVVPAVLKYLQEMSGCEDQTIVNALATAGLIGNLVKQNASISGAEAGCQAEIGTACAMAAAAVAQIIGGNLEQIEYAAEMGMEHHLGLTCDPVLGLVQIPCIERNVFAANRAVTCATYSLAGDGSHHISFDDVVHVMMETGRHMPDQYKETSRGGLAKKYRARHSTLSGPGLSVILPAQRS